MAALVPELSVADIAASRRFYCDILGFSVRYERPEEGSPISNWVRPS
jgi:catechol 2,3-dioxygenase-like lactoylglutathione lyase family enzyme